MGFGGVFTEGFDDLVRVNVPCKRHDFMRWQCDLLVEMQVGECSWEGNGKSGESWWWDVRNGVHSTLFTCTRTS